MKQYLDLLRKILDEGEYKDDRTGTGTISLFGHQMRFNLQDGFPLVTTKRVHFKSIVHELIWMINGDTNIKYLNDNGVRIWDEWADDNGDLGPIYGEQWRRWGRPGFGEPTIDQLRKAIYDIQENPDSRRIIVTAWQPSVLPDNKLSFWENVDQGNAALPPCHCFFQFYVSNNKLSCQMYQRSADVFLGVPFNIASYALLTHIIATVCHLDVGDFIHTFGDVHIYQNHVDQVLTQLKRDPLPLPKIEIDKSIWSGYSYINPDHIKLIDYESHPAIKAKVSV